MQTITTLFRLLIIPGILIVASCNRDDDSNPKPGKTDASKVFLKSQTIVWSIGSGHGGHGDGGGPHDSDDFTSTEAVEYGYTADNKLRFINNLEFVYDSEGRLIKTIEDFDTVKYFYSNGLLSLVTTNCGYYDGKTFSDSTSFYYNNDVLTYTVSTFEKTTTYYTFNNENLLASKVIKKTGPGFSRSDSLIFSWKDGNLVKISTRSGIPYTYEREYRYDDKPSYVLASHFPKEYLIVREITQFYGTQYPLFYYQVMPWRYNCRNNPIEFIERTNDQVRTIEYHISYDDRGLPLVIHGSTFQMELEYYQ